MTAEQKEFPWWQTKEIKKRPVQKNYTEFVNKFGVVKTTDDCYTPPAVYDAVIDFVRGWFPLDGYEILRPFKPGGDYLAENYTTNTVVIDNPPFSIYSKIVNNYLAMNVKFFLFAPGLTTFVLNAKCCYIITSTKIKYENGVIVNTNFVTNMMPQGILISALLKNKIEQAQHIKRKAYKKREYPPTLVTSATLCKFARMGINKHVKFDNYVTKYQGIKVFGYGVNIDNKDANFLQSQELAKQYRQDADEFILKKISK